MSATVGPAVTKIASSRAHSIDARASAQHASRSMLLACRAHTAAIMQACWSGIGLLGLGCLWIKRLEACSAGFFVHKACLGYDVSLGWGALLRHCRADGFAGVGVCFFC